MPRPRKQEPIKYCAHCGSSLERKIFGSRLEDYGVFLRRRYCSASCAAYAQHSIKAPLTIHAEITPPPSDAAGRKRSMKYVGTSCAACGDTESRLLVHHIDSNPKNDASANLQTLCFSCHVKWHRLHQRIGLPVSVPMPPITELASYEVSAMQLFPKSRRKLSAPG